MFQLWIRPAEGVTVKMLDIDIAERFLFVGIKGNTPYLHEQLTAGVKVDESM